MSLDSFLMGEIKVICKGIINMFSPNLITKKDALIIKTRELPLKGELLVKVGDFVNNDTVIGKTLLQGDLIIVRVSKELGLDPKDIEDLYLVNVNDVVKKGQVLVRKKGLFGIFNSEYVNKYDGRVEFISKETGNIGIRLDSKNFSLLSYIYGEVIECENEQSVTIKTVASVLQGVFGVGGEREGELFKLESLDDIPTLKNKVVFYNSSPSIEILNFVKEKGACGAIFPSITSKVLKEFLNFDINIAVTGDENIDFTIIITEGFGDISFNPKIISLLNESVNKKVSLNGTTQIRAGAVRPEVLIFDAPNDIKYKLALLNNKEQEECAREDQLTLKEGCKVKILKDPYFGKVATVINMPQKEQEFESAIVARAIEVSIDGSQVITKVPKANVEVIG